jgi:transcriptional regulator of NAD metabolism
VQARASLGRAERVVVLHPVSGEKTQRAVIHTQRQFHDHRALRDTQKSNYFIIQAHDVGDTIQALHGDIVRGVFSAHKELRIDSYDI